MTNQATLTSKFPTPQAAGTLKNIPKNLPKPKTWKFARMKQKGEVDLDIILVPAGHVFKNVLVSPMPTTDGIKMMAKLSFNSGLEIFTEARLLEEVHSNKYDKFLKRDAVEMDKINAFFEENPNGFKMVTIMHPIDAKEHKVHIPVGTITTVTRSTTDVQFYISIPDTDKITKVYRDEFCFIDL